MYNAYTGGTVVRTDIGYTGTRESLTHFQIEQVGYFLRHHRNLGFTRFHHGDCIGADAYAAWVAYELGYWVISHPPANNRLRAFAKSHEVRPCVDYLIRNGHIVAESHLGLVVPHSELPVERSGTWSTLRRFSAAEVPYWVVSPTRIWPS